MLLFIVYKDDDDDDDNDNKNNFYTGKFFSAVSCVKIGFVSNMWETVSVILDVSGERQVTCASPMMIKKEDVPNMLETNFIWT